MVAGTVCCILSALGYTAANICMRRLAALNCDPAWATCNKELVTVVVIGPWLVVRWLRRRAALPRWPVLAVLILVGLATQLGGNLAVQWALGVVGLAVTIPVIFGVMLTASAAMGRVLLGERVSRRSTAAIGLLIVSLVFLGISAGTAGKSISTGSGPMLIAAAVGASCLAGAIYALLTITIRRTVTGSTSLTAIVFIITATGVISLGPMAFYRLGAEQLLSTPAEHAAWMLAAGAFNLVAFLAITKGLELTTIVHANMLNASQVAMAALAGLVLFHEPINQWLILGAAITILGIILIDRPEEEGEMADQHA